MLTMTGLTKTYRTDTVETTALDDVDLDIADGEFVAIMGPSGCGKSTLLNVMGMLDSPTGGSYVFNGQEVAGLSDRSSPRPARATSASSSRASIWSTSSPFRECRDRLALSQPASSYRSERVDRVLDKVGSRTEPSIVRPSCRAASSSASPSPARLSGSPS